MRELTEVNAVSQDFIDLLQEVTSSLAVGAAEVELWSDVHLLDWSLHLSLATTNTTSGIELLLDSCVTDDIAVSINILLLLLVSSDETLCVSTFLEMDLAVLAEQLVAAFAFQRFEWELFANDALDFLNHLSLELVLNGIHLDVEGWNWLWSHELLNSLVG